MRRRRLVALGAAALGFSRAARAQQAANRVTIGFLVGSNGTTEKAWLASFAARLVQLGWVDGKNLDLEYRDVEGRNELAAEFASEFVRRKVDVIVATGTQAALAAKRATSTIPVVFALVTDPVGSGVVASLARPGANATGLTNQQSDSAGKRLSVWREIAPAARRLALLVNVGASGALLEAEEAQATARKLGMEVAVGRVSRAEEIAPAIAGLKGYDALYVSTDPLVAGNSRQINALAAEARMPTIWGGSRNFIEGGGLIFYGPSFLDLLRRAADYVDKILRGAKPGDLPVEQPTKFELAINLKTAKALGLTVPPSVLTIADEVIE